MINKDTIAMMRDSAILVNTSRGGLIDTDALIEALRARKFGGVGLDVYEDEDDQVFQDFSDDVLENEVVPVLLSFPQCGHYQPPGVLYPHGIAEHCGHHAGKCPRLCPR